MSARNSKAKSALPLVPATPGKANLNASRTDDELTLSVGNGGPSITIKNGARTNQREGAETYSVTAPVDKNDELVGWSIEKSGPTAGDDCSVEIRAKKTPSKPERFQKTGSLGAGD